MWRNNDSVDFTGLNLSSRQVREIRQNQLEGVKVMKVEDIIAEIEKRLGPLDEKA